MRSRRLKNEINVVPYIDVMLVLLVIFMVAAPMMSTGSVDLPSVGKSSLAPQDPMRVLVKADGEIALRDEKGQERQIDTAGLLEAVRTEQAKNPELAVLIAADKNVRYETVLDVLDTLKQQEIRRVGLETGQRQAQKPQGQGR
ncbi:MAG: protein TolR [Betaproteobacteria bacterium]|nr:protein TolR [Betaproteobacteria bacterium]